MTSTRFAILTVFALSACDVGTFGMSTGGGDDGIDPTVCGDRETATSSPAMPAFHNHTAPVIAGNMTNQGQGCIAANCHLGGQLGPSAPEYQFAGTLFADAAQTMPQTGAHIRVKDSTGKVIEAITDMFGNFSFPAGSSASPFPGQTSAAVCPSTGSAAGAGVSMMSTAIQAGGGNCNSAGTCHGSPLVSGMTALYLISQ
jgi:hypothetical protein